MKSKEDIEILLRSAKNRVKEDPCSEIIAIYSVLAYIVGEKNIATEEFEELFDKILEFEKKLIAEEN